MDQNVGTINFRYEDLTPQLVREVSDAALNGQTIGILGPPFSGKTLLSREVARRMNEQEQPFVEIPMRSLLDDRPEATTSEEAVAGSEMCKRVGAKAASSAWVHISVRFLGARSFTDIRVAKPHSTAKRRVSSASICRVAAWRRACTYGA